MTRALQHPTHQAFEHSHIGENPAALVLGDNYPVAKKQISVEAGRLALSQDDQPMAVRYLLQLIEASAPGGAVELRVPPFGAIQCIGGLDHRRGTPPNVVEISPSDFISLCQGEISWDALVEQGSLRASGVLAGELRNLFPLAGV